MLEINDKKQLIINEKYTFRPAVSKKITQNDVFYVKYEAASKIFLDILKSAEDDILSEEQEYNNNIIAFCGERGDGKTSAMLTFAYSVYNQSMSNEKIIEIEELRDRLKDIYVAEPIVIDPSTYDASRNIMDIVLAKLYKRFEDYLKKDNGNYDDKLKLYESQALINSFEEVYKCVSLIANPAKIKEQEYDYDGNIGNLSKLGESTRLKEKFEELIKKYLIFVENKAGIKSNSRKLIIAIDDLDLSNQNAYDIAEQIRKYLIIPNVVVIMALKLEQLQLCIVNNNLGSYSNINKDNYYNIKQRIHKMSEKYIAKLLPEVHRVILPQINDYLSAIVVNDYTGKKLVLGNNINEQITSLIRKKTGMVFITKINALLPDNIRDFVNLWNMLTSLESVKVNEITNNDKDINKAIANIDRFRLYVQNTIFSTLPETIVNELNKIDIDTDNEVHFNIVYLLVSEIYEKTDKKLPLPIDLDFLKKDVNNNSTGILERYEIKNEFSCVINWFEALERILQDSESKKQLFAIELLYTCKLNILKLKSSLSSKNEINAKEYLNFIGCNIWGKAIDDILPRRETVSVLRTRMDIVTEAFEKYIFENGNNLTERMGNDNKPYVENGRKAIVFKDNKDEVLKNWITLGLMSEGLTESRATGKRYIVSDERWVSKKLYVSLDNYIVALSNLYVIYDKLNLEKLGVTREEFDKYIEKIEKNNVEAITCAKYIISNIDCILELKKYCTGNRTIDEVISDGEKANKLYILKFFENIVKFINKNVLFKDELQKNDIFSELIIEPEINNNKQESIKIATNYAVLFFGYGNLVNWFRKIISNKIGSKSDSDVKDLMDEIAKGDIYFRYIEATVQKVETIEDHLVNMAINIMNIKEYFGVSPLDEDEIDKMCSYFEKLREYEYGTPDNDKRNELIAEYREIYNIYRDKFGIYIPPSQLIEDMDSYTNS